MEGIHLVGFEENVFEFREKEIPYDSRRGPTLRTIQPTQRIVTAENYSWPVFLLIEVQKRKQHKNIQVFFFRKSKSNFSKRGSF